MRIPILAQSRTCQHRSQCTRTATWGLYIWAQGESNVNLNKPVRVYCGQHKPRLHAGELRRNVKLVQA